MGSGQYCDIFSDACSATISTGSDIDILEALM